MSDNRPPKDTQLKLADINLWQVITQGVKPLKQERRLSMNEGGKKPPKKREKSTIFHPPQPESFTRIQEGSQGSSGQEIDAGTRRRLERGQIAFDFTLDLHGYSAAQAYAILQKTVVRSYASGHRCLLVITGKGKENQGVLKTSLPQWVREPALSNIVLECQTARPKHGGAGAYYLYLRRKR